MTAVLAAGVAAGVVLAGARAAPRTAHSQAVGCHPRLTVIARGQGSPDDLVWDGRVLLVSDINQGTIGIVANGHVRTVASHIGEPEGIVRGPGDSLIVAEQATNSVLEIKLPSGARTTLVKLPLPMGQTGIDGINADGAGAVYVPDSARGRLYVLHLRSRRLTLVANGMVRPVATINWDHAPVVADEYASAIWRMGDPRTKLARVLLPDDLAVISHHLISTSLLGKIWEVAPHLRLLSSAFTPPASDPQGMVADGPDSLVIADESRNSIYRLSRLTGCL
jgi:hypothetical protein